MNRLGYRSRTVRQGGGHLFAHEHVGIKQAVLEALVHDNALCRSTHITSRTFGTMRHFQFRALQERHGNGEDGTKKATERQEVVSRA
jgi:hypothetical protein